MDLVPQKIWVFEVREDGDGNEIERRPLFSSPEAEEAHAWLENFLKHLRASGPDPRGRMWVFSPEEPEITFYYAIQYHDDTLR